MLVPGVNVPSFIPSRGGTQVEWVTAQGLRQRVFELQGARHPQIPAPEGSRWSGREGLFLRVRLSPKGYFVLEIVLGGRSGKRWGRG